MILYQTADVHNKLAGDAWENKSRQEKKGKDQKALQQSNMTKQTEEF